MLDFQHWPASSDFLDQLKKIYPSAEEVASTPFRVLEQAGALTLRKYSAENPQKLPILLLPSVINRSFVLDLLPEKSLIKSYLQNGHDVYLIDWGVPQSYEQYLSFENLLSVYVDFLLAKVFQESGGKKLHIVGHCLGGTIGLLLANLKPDSFVSLSLLTAPVDFADDDKLSRWARHPEFDLEAFIEAYGNVPWFLLQSSFIALKPTQLLSKTRQYLTKARDNKFLRNFWAMEAWSNDNVNLRAKCFYSLLKDLYRANALSEGKVFLQGKRIDLSQLTLPIFTLIADHDHIVAKKSHLRSEMVPLVKNFEAVVVDGGHVGALIGGRSQKVLWPKMIEWMDGCEK